MAGEILHLVDFGAMLKEVGDGRYAKRMRGEPEREARVFEPPLDHAAHIDGRHPVLREGPPPTKDRTAKKGALLWLLGEPCGVSVGKEELFEVVPDRDLSGLAALLVK